MVGADKAGADGASCTDRGGLRELVRACVRCTLVTRLGEAGADAGAVTARMTGGWPAPQPTPSMRAAAAAIACW